jgi:hypothetical protein
MLMILLKPEITLHVSILSAQDRYKEHLAYFHIDQDMPVKNKTNVRPLIAI